MKLFNTKITAPMIFPPIFLVIIIISMWLSLSTIETNSKQNLHKSLDTVLTITQEALHLWLGNRLEELDYTVSDKVVIGLTEKLLDEYANQQDVISSPTLAKLRKLMAKKISQRNDKGFFVIAPDRVSIGSMRDSNIGKENLINQQRKPYLDRVFRGEKLFIPSISSDVPLVTKSGLLRDHQPTIFIASPVINADGNVIAVFTLRLDPTAHFTRITQLGSIGSSGETYAFDRKGVLVTESRFTEHLREIGAISADAQGMLSIRVANPGGDTLKGYVPTSSIDQWPLTLMASKAISGDTEPYMEAYRDYRGVPVFGAWQWDEVLGIGLVTEVDAEEGLHAYELTRIVIVSVLFFIMFLTIALVFLPLWFQEREKSALKQHRDSLENTVKKRTAELENANNNLKELSEIDPLTQIANRRLYEGTLSKAIAASKRASQAMSLMIIDIDYFKPFNDNYGHDVGDLALKDVAQAIAGSLSRSTDLAARYGGEEFVVLMPSTDSEGARHFANVIKNNIQARAIEHKFSGVAQVVTVSTGVSSLVGADLNDEDLFKQADSALYQAKKNGRNRVEVYQPEKQANDTQINDTRPIAPAS